MTDAHHYGAPHERWSVIDALAERIDHGLETDPFQRDPDFIRRMLPVMATTMRWYDPVVEDFDRLPEHGPFLMVSNHSGGMYMPDFYALLLRWFTERGTDEPLYSLGFDFLFSIPGVESWARRFGSVPASHDNADRALASGAVVLVYPGGDVESYRPWTARNRVDLAGRKGFVRLALRHGVPVYPVVASGSHDAIVVLTRGEHLAKLLRFDRLGIHILPILAGPPWGIAPVHLPTVPLPAKVTVRVCEPFDWTGLGPDAEHDETVVEHCYEEMLGRMQANLDELVAARPHPIAERLRGLLPFVS